MGLALAAMAIGAAGILATFATGGKIKVGFAIGAAVFFVLAVIAVVVSLPLGDKKATDAASSTQPTAPASSLVPTPLPPAPTPTPTETPAPEVRFSGDVLLAGSLDFDLATPARKSGSGYELYRSGGTIAVHDGGVAEWEGVKAPTYDDARDTVTRMDMGTNAAFGPPGPAIEKPFELIVRTDEGRVAYLQLKSVNMEEGNNRYVESFTFKVTVWELP